MDAETRVVLHNAASLARGRVLTIDLGPEVRDALAADGSVERLTCFTTDLRIARALGPSAVFGPWFDGEDPYEIAIVRMPRERERLGLLLAIARAALGPGGTVALVGHNKAGIRGARRRLGEAVGPPSVLDARAHCRLLVADAVVDVGAASLAAWRTTFDVDGLTIVSYPGVFSHGELDDGTRLLLEALPASWGGERVLDVGCGSGVITASLARAGARVTAVDVDALALHATRETMEENRLEATVEAADVFPDASFDAIVSNPAFHRGIRTTTEMSERLIAEAREHLARRGRLWIVANRFLDYGSSLERAFRSVEVVAADPGYRVWRAR